MGLIVKNSCLMTLLVIAASKSACDVSIIISSQQRKDLATFLQHG